MVPHGHNICVMPHALSHSSVLSHMGLPDSFDTLNQGLSNLPNLIGFGAMLTTSRVLGMGSLSAFLGAKTHTQALSLVWGSH